MLYKVESNTVTYHLQKAFKTGELDENSVARIFRVTASDGKPYNTKHYNLKAIIAVGNKVDSPKAVQFRKWANNIIEEYTIKGFAMDDERLKNGGTILTKDYFEGQLQRIRGIRLSERRFYQKITDIYATSIDYDSKANTTKLFLQRCKINFIGLFMERLRQRSFIIARIAIRQTWVLLHGKTHQMGKYRNLM